MSLIFQDPTFITKMGTARQLKIQENYIMLLLLPLPQWSIRQRISATKSLYICKLSWATVNYHLDIDNVAAGKNCTTVYSGDNRSCMHSTEVYGMFWWNHNSFVLSQAHGRSYFTRPRYRPQAGAMGLAAVTVLAFRILSTEII